MIKQVGFLGEPGEKDPVRLPFVVGRISAAVRARVEKVRLLGLDVDGVMTDGRLYYHDDGSESKVFDVRDGHGIKMLQRGEIKIALLSGRRSPCVEKRAQDLGITYVSQGIGNKVEILEQFLSKEGLTLEQAAFMGDDLVDLPVMSAVGLPIAVADASEYLFERAHYVTASPGGQGAVREVAELILAVQGKWNAVAKPYFA